jgi:uncharacterized protein
MGNLQIIAAGAGIGLHLERGQTLRLVDPEGGQSGDLMAFSRDGRERLSNGRTFDYGGKIYLSAGDTLWSDRSRPLLTIVADDVGQHDFLYSPCSIEMYRMQYGVRGHHANCYDNLLSGLRGLGLDADYLPTAFNFFMNATVDLSGRLIIAPPKSRAGDSITMRAETDLAIAISACPASGCNGGTTTKPLAFEVS